MGKASKKSKKTKAAVYTDPEKDFYNGTGKFNFPNGDEYEGDYCAHVSGIVWREGSGTYTTKDGHKYIAQWYSDKIIDNTEITIIYPNGERYTGNIIKNKYSGPGCYYFSKDVILSSEFSDNKPVGSLILLDVNGQSWHSEASETNTSIFLPEHSFYTNISDDLGKGKMIHSPKILTDELVGEEMLMEDQPDLESKIFAKSTLTQEDIYFEQSDWYQNYLAFRKTHFAIMRTIDQLGVDGLNSYEKEWLENFKAFKQRYNLIINNRKSPMKENADKELYDLFNSSKYKATSIPIPVIYATRRIQSDSDNDSLSESSSI